MQLNMNLPSIERAANQVNEHFHPLKGNTANKGNQQQQSTPINDSNPISPLSVNSQASGSDSGTNQQQDQHRYLYDFSKVMLHSYHSSNCWRKAENLTRERPIKGELVAFRFPSACARAFLFIRIY
jgi:hypothetical protein